MRYPSLRCLALASFMVASPILSPIQDAWAQGGAARSDVTVRFVEPQRFTDAENRFGSGLGLRGTLGEIRRIFEVEGARMLHPGQSLVLDILDIDLAGFEQPFGTSATNVRVVRDVTPPRFRLRYLLSERGRRVAEGEETLTDQNFLWSATRNRIGTFPYETTLIQDWLRRRFPQRPEARG